MVARLEKQLVIGNRDRNAVVPHLDKRSPAAAVGDKRRMGAAKGRRCRPADHVASLAVVTNRITSPG
jgi:hypothetical protein